MKKDPFSSSDNDYFRLDEPGLLQRIGSAWLRLSCPDPRRFTTNIPDQERLRRARLLSIMLVLIPVAVIIGLPNAFAIPSVWIALITISVLGIGAGLLNRQGYITWAGFLYIAAIDTAVTLLMTTQPQGITSSNLPDFDLYLISVLISGLVLRRQFIPLIAIAHIVLVIAIFSLLPHDPLFIREVMVHQGGQPYVELTDAYLLQICGGTLAWLGAWSVDRALARASHAEELAEARLHIEQQACQISEQKQRLEQGIAILKDAQSQVANGDYSARASLQNNVETCICVLTK